MPITTNTLPIPTVPTELIPPPQPNDFPMVEASTLGWKPGYFPEKFEYTGHDGWADLYRYIAHQNRGEDIFWVLYRGVRHQRAIQIIND